jgi:protein phosphatase
MIPSETTDLIVAQNTHAGETGKNNEDRAVVAAFRESQDATEVVTLAMVADGIGGHAAGEIASDLAVRSAYDHLARAEALDPLGTLQAALLAANQAIYERSHTEANLQGMGSTAVVALIVGRRLYVAHVADSRMYLIRNGAIQQLTVDHTWVQEAISAGLLTREEARKHPNRHVIRRYLGHNLESNPVDLTVQYAPGETLEQMERNQGALLQPGDMLLLCSDGLTDLVEDDEILSLVTENEPQAATEQLVLLARKRGGFDNITVILLEVPQPPVLAAAPAAPTRLAATPPRPRRRRSVLAVGLVGLAAVVGLLAVAAVVVVFFMNQGQLAASPPTEAPAAATEAAEPIEPEVTVGAALPPGDASATATPEPNPSPAVATVTAAPSEAASASPTAQPFITINAEAAVRAGPSPNATELGVLLPDSTVKVFGRDPDGLWWFVEFPQGTASRGWVFRNVTTLTGAIRDIPIVNSEGTPLAPAAESEDSAPPGQSATSTP